MIVLVPYVDDVNICLTAADDKRYSYIDDVNIAMKSTVEPDRINQRRRP
jgi:hypothetical protein